MFVERCNGGVPLKRCHPCIAKGGTHADLPDTPGHPCGTNFFFEWIPAGEYTLTYRLRASMAGTFKLAPATMQSMYAPEFAAFSAGDTVTVDLHAAAAVSATVAVTVAVSVSVPDEGNGGRDRGVGRVPARDRTRSRRQRQSTATGAGGRGSDRVGSQHPPLQAVSDRQTSTFQISRWLRLTGARRTPRL